jgi:hypothetical protein
VHSGNSVLSGCSAPPPILSWPPQLCQNGGFSVLPSIGETWKNKVGWDDSHVVFSGEWSVRLRVVVMQNQFFHCQSSVRSLRIFNAVAVIRHSFMRNWSVGLPGRTVFNDPLDVKEDDEHALYFALHLSLLFRSALSRACHSNTRVRLMHYSSNACLIVSSVSIVLFTRFAQNLMLFLCRTHHKIALRHVYGSK